jgi:outer membrane protein TolC
MIGGLAGALLAVVPSFTTLSLDAAEARIVANSAGVATAHAVARQRESDLRLARIAGVPHIVGDYALAPQAAPTGTATVEQHLLAIGAGVSVNDVVNASPQARVAAAELLAAERDADAAALQARTDAIRLYFAALESIAVETVRRDEMRAAARDVATAHVRAATGEAPQLDVMRADVSLAQAQADGARASAARANAVDALASAAQVDAALLIVTPSGSGSVTPTQNMDERRAVARALASRPEIASLLAGLEARKANLEVARRAAWPVVTASAGFEGGVDTAIPVHGPQAAVHLDVPLAPGGGERVAAAHAQVDAIEAQLLEARRTIALAVTAAVRTARASEAAERAADRARDEARRSLDAVELGYHEGASSSLDVAEARRTYAQAAVDALVARYDSAQDFALVDALVP